MNEFERMIESAELIKQETEKNENYKVLMKSNIENINRRINESKEQGRTNTCWNISSYLYIKGVHTFVCDIEYELKQLYKSKGYSFRPTGYIGGVYQLTENICW